MAVKYFYDLPVYRLSNSAYDNERAHYIDEYVKEAFGGLSPLPDHVANLKQHIGQHFYDKYGPWCFNEITGYIRLHFLGSQVRGEYFAPAKKRCVKTRTKVFIHKTHKLAPERGIPAEATNAEILGVINSYVDDCRRELPRRFIDDEWLRRIGPMVDWRRILRP
jgi:hypothetical protein